MRRLDYLTPDAIKYNINSLTKYKLSGGKLSFTTKSEMLEFSLVFIVFSDKKRKMSNLPNIVSTFAAQRFSGLFQELVGKFIQTTIP